MSSQIIRNQDNTIPTLCTMRSEDLFKAIDRGDVEGVETALAAGCSPSDRDFPLELGLNPLQTAFLAIERIYYGSLEFSKIPTLMKIVEILLDAGANPVIPKRDPAYHWFIEPGVPELLAPFIKRDIDIHIRNRNLQTPLHISFRGIVTPLPLVAGEETLEPAQLERVREEVASLETTTEMLLSAGADVNEVDIWGENAMFYLLRLGLDDPKTRRICTLLIEKGIDLDAKSKEGLTALDVAEEYGIKDLFVALKNGDPLPTA